jgi:hypothetical protein
VQGEQRAHRFSTPGRLARLACCQVTNRLTRATGSPVRRIAIAGRALPAANSRTGGVQCVRTHPRAVRGTAWPDRNRYR